MDTSCIHMSPCWSWPWACEVAGAGVRQPGLYRVIEDDSLQTGTTLIFISIVLIVYQNCKLRYKLKIYNNHKLQQIVPFVQSKLYKIQFWWSVKGGKMKLQISSYFSVSVFTQKSVSQKSHLKHFLSSPSQKSKPKGLGRTLFSWGPSIHPTHNSKKGLLPFSI